MAAVFDGAIGSLKPLFTVTVALFQSVALLTSDFDFWRCATIPTLYHALAVSMLLEVLLCPGDRRDVPGTKWVDLSANQWANGREGLWRTCPGQKAFISSFSFVPPPEVMPI